MTTALESVVDPSAVRHRYAPKKENILGSGWPLVRGGTHVAHFISVSPPHLISNTCLCDMSMYMSILMPSSQRLVSMHMSVRMSIHMSVRISIYTHALSLGARVRPGRTQSHPRSSWRPEACLLAPRRARRHCRIETSPLEPAKSCIRLHRLIQRHCGWPGHLEVPRRLQEHHEDTIH